MHKNFQTQFTSLLFAIGATISLQAQNVLKVEAGTVISSTGGVVISLNDMDLDNDGIFNQGNGQGILVFKGTINSFISGSASPQFDILQLSKTGGGKLILQRGIQIGSSITFDSGILDLNGQNILLSPSGLLINESENSRITGSNGGYVQIIRTLNAPTSVNLGNLGVVFSSTKNLGSVIIRRGHQTQTNVFGNGNTIFRYYDIIPANDVDLNAKLRFNYLDAELNSLNENDLTIWSSFNNQHWTNLGFAARNTNSNHVDQEGVNRFNRLTLTGTSNPLPLIWGSFNTKCVAGQTWISWKTLQEQNTAFFIVRRSTNANTWSNIGSIPAAGNNQSTKSYSYTDHQSLVGTTYYQVLQQDLDGRQTYSPVLVSRCGEEESIIAYPIPAQNNCWVSIQSERSNTVSMQLFNGQGALLKQQVVEIMTGNNVFELSLANYPRGVYSLVCTWSDGRVKVIKVEKI